MVCRVYANGRTLLGHYAHYGSIPIDVAALLVEHPVPAHAPSTCTTTPTGASSHTPVTGAGMQVANYAYTNYMQGASADRIDFFGGHINVVALSSLFRAPGSMVYRRYIDDI